MKKIKDILQPYQSRLKTVFFVIVSILVIVELTRLSKTISIADIKRILDTIPLFNLILILVIGFITVCPMVWYDIILNKMLKTNYSKSYIFETGFATNAINNLAGFAGLVEIGLRYSFYSEGKASDESVAQQISKVMPFFMSGLSIYSGISLVCLLLPQGNHGMMLYLPVILGGMLYLPFVYFISARKSLTYFGQLNRTYRHQLLLASFLDWTGVLLSFISIGYLAGFHLPIYDLIPIYIIAVVVGLMSMIPSGIGGFDIVLISGLTSAGLGHSQAVTWLLLFRIAYYILPFLVGVGFFIKHIGGRVNQKFLGLPKTISTALTTNLELAFLKLFVFFSFYQP